MVNLGSKNDQLEKLDLADKGLQVCNCKPINCGSSIWVKMLTPGKFEINLGIVTWFVALSIATFYYQIGGAILVIGFLALLTLIVLLVRLAMGHKLKCILKNSLMIAFGIIGFWPNGL